MVVVVTSSFWGIILFIGYLSYKPLIKTTNTSKWAAVEDRQAQKYFLSFWFTG